MPVERQFWLGMGIATAVIAFFARRPFALYAVFLALGVIATLGWLGKFSGLLAWAP